MSTDVLKRVVGLVVIAFVVALVLKLLPEHGEKSRPGAIPVVAVPVGATSPAAAASASSAVGAANGNVHEPEAPPAVEANASAASAVPQVPPPATRPAPTREATSTPAPAAKPAAKPAVPHVDRLPAPQSHGNFYVQIASFSDAANAAKSLTKLRALGYRGTLRPVTVNGKPWQRVQVGPYADETMAQTAQRKLRSQGYAGSRVVAR